MTITFTPAVAITLIVCLTIVAVMWIWANN